MQLSDSALPIGTASHSFGMESLVEFGFVEPVTLRAFLRSYLQGQAVLEACFCRAAFAAFQGRTESTNQTAALCRRLSALRTARESRDASISLGQRLLAIGVSILPADSALALAATFATEDAHHAIVFGSIAAALGLEPEIAIAAYLQQSIAMFTFAAQRLMAVGQRQAVAEQWNLKQEIARVVESSRGLNEFTASSFMPMTEIGSMRHPRLETRLFLS